MFSDILACDDFWQFVGFFKIWLRGKNWKNISNKCIWNWTKNSNLLLNTWDCEVWQNYEIIDVDVITKAKEDITDAADAKDNARKDWIGKDPKTEYHFVDNRYLNKLMYKSNQSKNKFLCKTCSCLCSSNDVYATHLKQCLELNEGQKTIFSIKNKELLHPDSHPPKRDPAQNRRRLRCLLHR